MHRFFLLAVPFLLSAQTLTLTIDEARALALKKHPALAAQSLQAHASSELPKQLRAGLGPQFSLGASGAAAEELSRFVFTGVNSPLLVSRVGGGLQLSQLIHDFGRSRESLLAAKLRVKGQEQLVQASRLQVLLGVERAYFALLRADVQKDVADQIFETRRAMLAGASDPSAAQLSVMEAEFQLAKALNDRNAAEAELLAAIGIDGALSLTVKEAAGSPALPPNLESILDQAVQSRPELRALAIELEASEHVLEAEKRANRPTISALAVAGLIPATTFNTINRYGSASVNVNIPLWNGRISESRQNELGLRSQALEKLKEDRSKQISRELRVAYFNAKTALERLKLTQAVAVMARKRRDESKSVAEKHLAQLTLSTAEGADRVARYDYLSLCSSLHLLLGDPD